MAATNIPPMIGGPPSQQRTQTTATQITRSEAYRRGRMRRDAERAALNGGEGSRGISLMEFLEETGRAHERRAETESEASSQRLGRTNIGRTVEQERGPTTELGSFAASSRGSIGYEHPREEPNSSNLQARLERVRQSVNQAHQSIQATQNSLRAGSALEAPTNANAFPSPTTTSNTQLDSDQHGAAESPRSPTRYFMGSSIDSTEGLTTITTPPQAVLSESQRTPLAPFSITRPMTDAERQCPALHGFQIYLDFIASKIKALRAERSHILQLSEENRAGLRNVIEENTAGPMIHTTLFPFTEVSTRLENELQRVDSEIHIWRRSYTPGSSSRLHQPILCAAVERLMPQVIDSQTYLIMRQLNSMTRLALSDEDFEVSFSTITRAQDTRTNTQSLEGVEFPTAPSPPQSDQEFLESMERQNGGFPSLVTGAESRVEERMVGEGPEFNTLDSSAMATSLPDTLSWGSSRPSPSPERRSRANTRDSPFSDPDLSAREAYKEAWIHLDHAGAKGDERRQYQHDVQRQLDRMQFETSNKYPYGPYLFSSLDELERSNQQTSISIQTPGDDTVVSGGRLNPLSEARTQFITGFQSIHDPPITNDTHDTPIQNTLPEATSFPSALVSAVPLLLEEQRTLNRELRRRVELASRSRLEHTINERANQMFATLSRREQEDSSVHPRIELSREGISVDGHTVPISLRTRRELEVLLARQEQLRQDVFAAGYVAAEFPPRSSFPNNRGADLNVDDGNLGAFFTRFHNHGGF
ncbi:MAG: hypothetical protein M1827_000367 [Pycnora praestabilis]|nr:MAG: hypothetical protein M1827_000367 [Pycnora praestabilis]